LVSDGVLVCLNVGMMLVSLGEYIVTSLRCYFVTWDEVTGLQGKEERGSDGVLE